MFADDAAFEAWLQENHNISPGIWMHFAKKNSPLRSVSYPEAVDISLCYGWIDGQAKSLDEHSYLQRFTPRRARSIWSKINCAKVEKLIKQGRMQPAGLAEIERAQWAMKRAESPVSKGVFRDALAEKEDDHCEL